MESLHPRAAAHIAVRALRSQWRSRSFLVQTLVLPLALTAIIGTALGGGGRLDPVPVALVGPDDAVSRGLARVLKDSGLARVSHLGSAEAEAGVLAGRLVAALELPADLARSARSPAGEATVRLLTDPASRVRTVTIEQLARSYLSRLEAGRAAVLATAQTLRPPDAETLGTVLTAAQASVTADLENPRVGFVSRSVASRSAGFFAYYAVAFGVLFALLTATLSAGGLLEEAAGGTLARLLASPAGPLTLLAGQLGALFLVAAVQLGLFVAATALAFSVAWGPPITVAVAVLAVSAGAAGLGGLTLGLARTPEQLSVIGLGLVLLMGLLGGSMYPLDSLPGAVQTLSRFTFNRWAIEAFSTVAAPGLGLEEAGGPLLVMIGLAVAGFAFAALRLSGRYRQ